MKNKFTFSSRKAGIFAAIFMLLVSWGCSTQKNKLPNRLYHSLNAKYNGYFNARENYNEGIKRLSAAHIDNYDNVLNIFRYGNEQQASSISNYMDVAYQKASIVIRRHSMNIRGVEYNTWIDESFFLIARSHFFKRDYNLAILTFEYIVRQYESDIKYQAKAWIAKSYHQLGRYDEAMQLLDRLTKNQSDGVLGKESSRLYYLVYADHFIRQERYAEAAPYLSEGIRLTPGKREKTRLTFILAQAYQHGGDFNNAQQTYARVLKMNPGFDLAFQTRISMAMAFDPSGSSGDNIKSELLGMLRDDRNKPYQDQIYYALAQLSMRQNREAEAIDYFIKSAEVSDANKIQKGLSFARLGEIFFSHPEYLRSSIYYDSAAVYLPPQHEAFQTVSERKSVLSVLSSNIRIIEREDSLQRLAAMPEAARNAVVDKIIEDLREEERQAKLVEQQMMRAASTIAQTRIRGGLGAQEGGWYFYNTTAMSFGRTEFFSKFGERPLEDMWRISNKQTAGFDMAMEDEFAEEEEVAGDIYDRNTYLRNIPSSPELLEASNSRLANAYYNNSMVFKDRLNDFPSAVQSLETLVERYPGSSRQLFAYYYLYNLHRELGNSARANIYRDRLVSEFPESDFAQILGDPDYLNKVLARQRYGKNLYQQAYLAFSMGQYQETLTKTEEADSLDLPKELKSQFAYIRALANGKLGKRSDFKKELETVVAEYDGLPVHLPASTLLASLDVPGALPLEFGEEEEVVAVSDPGFVSIFSYNPEAVHFFVFVVQTAQIEVPRLRNLINTFNNLSFSESALSVSSVFLDDRRQVITVTNFPDKSKGMEYYTRLMAQADLAAFNQQAFSGFLISVDNYPVFYQEKNVDDYRAFFQNYYINR